MAWRWCRSRRYAIVQTTASMAYSTQVAARNRTVQREREAKDRVANATTIRRKSEQVVVETLKPRNDEDSDTATDDDDENLNALDDWLARPADHRKAPASTETVEDVSPYCLVAFHALAVWRWFFVLCQRSAYVFKAEGAAPSRWCGVC